MDGCGTLDVSEHLAARPARKLRQSNGFRGSTKAGIHRLRHSHGGPFLSGLQRQPVVGEGHAAPAATHPQDQLGLEH